MSYWLALPVQALAGGFLIRVFIIFHDCGHGSFFASRKANDVVGFLTGVLTLTPYQDWRDEHARHHATAGDLDRRGARRRVDHDGGRVPRSDASGSGSATGSTATRSCMFGLGPVYVFAIKQRFPRSRSGPRGRRSVLLTDLALVAVVGTLFATIGVGKTLLVHLPILAIGGAAGIWLFYVQHQFEGVYWEHRDKRDYVAVAMQGSSFYALPRILQWFSGNIGFHHIHHLSPTIPNYRLPECHREQEVFQKVDRLTLRRACVRCACASTTRRPVGWSASPRCRPGRSVWA